MIANAGVIPITVLAPNLTTPTATTVVAFNQPTPTPYEITYTEADNDWLASSEPYFTPAQLKAIRLKKQIARENRNRLKHIQKASKKRNRK